IGLVGPMSNYAAPPQLGETVPYRFGPRKSQRPPANGAGDPLVSVEERHRFAWDHSEKQGGEWREAERLGGLCLVVNRSVPAKMGSRDRGTELSLCASDILSAKARKAGFTLACCRDLCVHHLATRTSANGAPPVEAKRTEATRQ